MRIKHLLIGLLLSLFVILTVSAVTGSQIVPTPRQGGTGTSSTPSLGDFLIGNSQGVYTLVSSSLYYALPTSTVVSTSYGGTGITSTPSVGDMLIGTSTGYTLVSSSYIRSYTSSTIIPVIQGGTGTSTPPSLDDVIIGDGTGGYKFVSTSYVGNLLWYVVNYGVNVIAPTSTYPIWASNGLIVSTTMTFDNATGTNLFLNSLRITDNSGVASTQVLYLTDTYGRTVSMQTYSNNVGGGYLRDAATGTNNSTFVVNDGINDVFKVGDTTNSSTVYHDFEIGGNLAVTGTAILNSTTINSATTTNLFASTTQIGTDTSTIFSVYASTTFYNNLTATSVNGLYFNFATATQSMLIGFQSGRSIAGAVIPQKNVFIGHQTGWGTMSSAADYNTAVGYQVLKALTSGTQNTGLGYLVLTGNTTGNYNTAFGSQALNSNIGADYNVAIGISALGGINGSTATDNTCVGSYCMLQGTTNTRATALGARAFYSYRGRAGLALGAYACNDVQFEDYTFCVDTMDRTSAANDRNYALMYGRFSSVAAASTSAWVRVSGNFGINTNTPQYPLTVYGSSYLTGSSTVLAGVYLPDYTPGVTTNALYNSGGSLLFNGATVGGGDTTLATQQGYTSVFSATFVNTTTITTSLASIAIASSTLSDLEQKIVRWTDVSGVTYKYGWIKGASQNSSTITLTINGNPILSNDTNFSVSRNTRVEKFHWFVPGQCVADATNPVGVWFSIPSTTIKFLSLDGLLGQPNTSTLTVNLYASSTYGTSQLLFSSAPDFGANNYTIENAQFTTSTVSGKAMINLLTPACGSGGNGANMDISAYYIYASWQ